MTSEKLAIQFEKRPEQVKFCIRSRMTRTHETLPQAVKWWDELLVRVRRGVDADEETIAGHLRNVLEAPKR